MSSYDDSPNERELIDSTVPPSRTMEGIKAREAAVKVLWDKRSMLPEHSEEIVEDVIDAVVPFFEFSRELLREALLRWNVDQELGSSSALDGWIDQFLAEDRGRA